MMHDQVHGYGDKHSERGCWSVNLFTHYDCMFIFSFIIIDTWATGTKSILLWYISPKFCFTGFINCSTQKSHRKKAIFQSHMNSSSNLRDFVQLSSSHFVILFSLGGNHCLILRKDCLRVCACVCRVVKKYVKTHGQCRLFTSATKNKNMLPVNVFDRINNGGFRLWQEDKDKYHLGVKYALHIQDCGLEDHLSSST